MVVIVIEVIPEERENLLLRKVNEPMLSERIKRDNWNFIRYSDLEGFYIETKNVSIIKPVQIEALAKMPSSKGKERQSHFDEYNLER